MAPIQSHHHMASSHTCDTYSVVFKIHGSTIRFFDSSLNNLRQVQATYRLLCRDLETRDSNQGSEIRAFTLDKSTTPTDRSLFQYQGPCGQEMTSEDLVIFMTAPIDSSRRATYAIDIGIHGRGTSIEDSCTEDCKKLGTAYIYLEPKFSTQGIQRMQIMGNNNKTPIGQIQVEYLIVTNPSGYGIKASRPDWLSRFNQLDAGHRGAGSGCRADLKGNPLTENTVASFNYAARHGADMCELDVMCTADGVPVVYHNYMLNTSKPLQIDELTLEELRNLAHRSIHDENCKHDKENTTNGSEMDRSYQQFPTLEEVLRDVDKSCVLNIELKWAQILSNGKSEATHYREINDFVDRILDCICKHHDGRPILLSTLNADIAIMLRLKQTEFPVLFLTTGDSSRFNDPATKTIKNAIHFAQAFDMAGINPNAKMLNEFLVQYAKDRGLLVYAWGDIRSAQTIKELRRYGLNGVIYDKIDLIKPKD